jgi:hypothetical protein
MLTTLPRGYSRAVSRVAASSAAATRLHAPSTSMRLARPVQRAPLTQVRTHMTRDNYYLKPIPPVDAPTYHYKYLAQPATAEVGRRTE